MILLPALMTFPARGTWIEMLHPDHRVNAVVDVPRKGNVDRNVMCDKCGRQTSRTFPARGTWIEIYLEL